MAIAIAGTPVASTQATTSTSFNVTLPTGIVSGELLRIAVETVGNSTITPPAGWTATSTQTTDGFGYQKAASFHRIADGTEGSTAAFTASTSVTWSALAWRVSGVNVAAPIEASATPGTATTGTAATAPSVTTLTANAMVERIGFTAQQASAPTIPAGHTSIGSASSGTSNTDGSFSVAYVTQAVPGASGTADFTVSGLRPWITFTISIASAAPTIDTQPQNKTVSIGQTATFSVTATASSGSLSYQWQLSINGGASWNNVASGGTSSSYTTKTLTFSDNGNQYRVQVTDSNGSVTSDAAILTVPSPAITTQPANQYFDSGFTATFSVVADTAAGPLTYQWFVQQVSGAGFSEISGATSSSYTTGTLTASNNGWGYLVRVSDSSSPGVLYSDVAYLTRNTASPSVAPGPFDPAIFDSNIFDVYVNVAGSLATTETGSDTFVASGTVASSGTTGTLAATETGSDTFAASGTVLVSGSLAATETGSDTFAASGTVLVSGSLAATETGSDTFAASGTVLVSGSLAATETGSDTFAASGTVLVSGSLAATETGSDTFAATGTVTAAGISGSLAATESGSDTFAASGTVLVSGSLAVTESGADVFAATGTVASPVVLTAAQALLVYQICELHGLINPLSVAATSRSAGAVVQSVVESSGTVTVTTTSLPTSHTSNIGLLIEELAALHGLTVPLVVTATSRVAGSISQTMSVSGGVTTVTRI